MIDLDHGEMFMDNKRLEKRLFIVTGGSFAGMGALSMLFIVVDELKKRFPDCRIVADVHSEIPDGLAFSCVNILPWMWKSFCNPVFLGLVQIRRILRHFLTDFPASTSWREANRLVRSADAIIDVSGFALSSQFDNETSVFFLDRIRAAEKLHIPVFLLPQSYGPFDYKRDRNRLCSQIKKQLSYPRIIFAREQRGYRLLTEECALTNVRLSPDIVLQNSGIDYAQIYREPFGAENLPKLAEGKKVAIIPNQNLYRIGKKEVILKFYEDSIRELCSKGFIVYLINHTKMDLSICDDILCRVNSDSVIKVPLVMKIREFEMIIGNFDFVIGSRYHGIVHALKQGVPVISVGWAIKYKELMELFDQRKYDLDIRNDQDMSRALEAIQDMEKNYSANHEKILSILPKYRGNSCFEEISTYFDQQ